MGSRGPLPKDPEKLLGHRRRADPKPPVAVSPAAAHPARDEWRDDTKAAWDAYWSSDMAAIAVAVDTPAISRLFAMYDQHARSMELVSRALVVKGSTGQVRTNPLADHALRLESAIVRLENELGLTPAARQRMGVTIARAPQGQASASETKPSRYAHLRTVAS